MTDGLLEPKRGCWTVQEITNRDLHEIEDLGMCYATPIDDNRKGLESLELGSMIAKYSGERLVWR